MSAADDEARQQAERDMEAARRQAAADLAAAQEAAARLAQVLSQGGGA
ncbi:hypothetical protein [Streptomyces sp. 8L]|nr:hypothetical protein [Streptomyces sp. 8L]MCA1222193.1 hypothetical protein [Streptomyces sp. 8L]